MSSSARIRAEEDQYVIEHLRDSRLVSARESARGITYTEPLFTGWKPPLRIRRMKRKDRDFLRSKHGVTVTVDAEIESEFQTPPPMESFDEMRFAEPILKKLREKGFDRPTPIQAQALPVALSGRDLIGLSSTGSGKSLAFILPLIMICLQEEMMMRVDGGEGPIGLIVCPGRELATQTFETVMEFLGPLGMRGSGYPELRAMLCIGGVSLRSQVDVVRKGVHIVVATPGRLRHLLDARMMNLDHCRCLVLDEADKLVDRDSDRDRDGNEDSCIRNVLNHFKSQRQTLLFSATMPSVTQDSVVGSLVKPVTISVGGRAGAANLDVVQEVEYVKEEAKFVHLLECLQKSPPPVLIFCRNKPDVDNICHFLLLKGVDAVALHADKSQEDRALAVLSFKEGKKDVLVATDVASKGLHFPGVMHVINYDMTDKIEDYVHRIGRTGRCGKTGLATTFIYRAQLEKPTVLLDLKLLLEEAKQRIPPVLAELGGSGDVGKGCERCGGLGHRILDCPELRPHRHIDFFGSGGYRAEV